MALEYLEMDIVPRPSYVARASLLGGGYVAMEDLKAHGEELDRFLDKGWDSMTPGERRLFAHGLSEFFGRLLEKGIIHRDLKACNVFVLSDGFRLLDVEDILFAAPTEETMRRMLVQLNTSVPERISVADRVRFFVNLVSGFSLDRKRLLREVARLSRNEEIVYEGVSGLKKESWRGRRRGSLPPSSTSRGP